jgi:transcriptional/translational regulatory protein YebC/TACO1
VPVIVECLTDNRNRTAPDMRSLFREGQFGAKVMFLFDHVGTIEATHANGSTDREGAAIEAGAQDVEPLEETPEGQCGARFFTEPADLDAVLRALKAAGWSVTTSEMGYRPKDKLSLSPEQRGEVEEFLEAIDDHDDCHRIYTTLA